MATVREAAQQPQLHGGAGRTEATRPATEETARRRALAEQHGIEKKAWPTRAARLLLMREGC
jgi:hypothetical protein